MLAEGLSVSQQNWISKVKGGGPLFSGRVTYYRGFVNDTTSYF